LGGDRKEVAIFMQAQIDETFLESFQPDHRMNLPNGVITQSLSAVRLIFRSVANVPKRFANSGDDAVGCNQNMQSKGGFRVNSPHEVLTRIFYGCFLRSQRFLLQNYAILRHALRKANDRNA